MTPVSSLTISFCVSLQSTVHKGQVGTTKIVNDVYSQVPPHHHHTQGPILSLCWHWVSHVAHFTVPHTLVRFGPRHCLRELMSCKEECAPDTKVASTYVDVSNTCHSTVLSANCYNTSYQFVLVASHSLFSDPSEGISMVFCKPKERHSQDQLHLSSLAAG